MLNQRAKERFQHKDAKTQSYTKNRCQMAENCNCPPEAGKASCELTLQTSPAASRPVSVCPANGQKGKPVQNQTLKAMLRISLRAVIETEYLFCSSSDCPVVYFSADGSQTFSVEQLREAVYQKEPGNPAVPVCYCFQHSLGSIKTASIEQRQTILTDIKQGISAGQCACDLRNPQGSCCLGNVSKAIKSFETSD